MDVRVHGGATDFERPTVSSRQDWFPLHGEGLYRSVFKRVLDIGLVLLALPIVLPTVLVLAALISLDAHSPFYRQKRLGKGGRVFILWKLRSMVPDAEARLSEHLAGNDVARHEWDAYQKLVRDPRITPIGQLLRKCSLDELPQLWNVLTGDMSLVGPRPMMPEQLPLYPGHAYFALRPGVTGFWQVSARNASTFAQRAEFDADYDRKLSLAADLRVLLATVRVVLRGTGN
jgi:lipopolysaccharide/colanic/teichoic acid biosynthesis glycosyltransferase